MIKGTYYNIQDHQSPIKYRKTQTILAKKESQMIAHRSKITA